MSTSYQSLAKPRGRHKTINPDVKGHSRARSAASLLTKKMSRIAGDTQSANTSRSNSPALFLQRNRALDENPIHDNPVSPKSSASSLKIDPQLKDDGNVSNLSPSTKSASRFQSSTDLIAPSTESHIDSVAPPPHAGSPPLTPVDKALDSPTSSKAAPSSFGAHEHDFSDRPPSRDTSTTMSVSGLQPPVDAVDENSEVPILQTASKAPSEIIPVQPTEHSVSGSVSDLGTPRPGNESTVQIPDRTLYSATPLVSPPQSPRLTHGIYNGQLPYYYPAPMYGSPYIQAPFSPSSEKDGMRNEGFSGKISPREENENLLHKISDVIPEIHRLLDQYRETHGQLSAKDLLAKQAEAIHAEQLNKLQVELQVTKTEYEKVIREIVEENLRFKREIEDLRKQVSATSSLEEENAGFKVSMEKLQKSYEDLNDRIDDLNQVKEQVLREKNSQDKLVESLQERLSEHAKTIAERQDQHSKALEERDIRFGKVMEEKDEEHRKILGEHKIILSKVQLELANLITKHSNQKKDLEATRNSEAQHKNKLEAKSRELEEAIARHQEELQALRTSNEEERQQLVSESEGRVARLIDEHMKEKEELMQSLDTVHAEMQTQNDDFAKERQAHEAAKEEHEELISKHADLAAGMTNWKAKHMELQKENEKMDRLLQALGHATEIQSKGDLFYVTAFQALAESIIRASNTFFQQVPPQLPMDVTRRLPREIPHFMAATPAANCLRALFIQHKVYEVLNSRLFRPFIFTLEPHNRDMDIYLSNVFGQIRAKSERRASLWSQITLRAAFAGGSAKEAAKLVAATMVDEIIEEIQYFAVHSMRPVLVTAVRRIVKSAVELWRRARVERGIITAQFPSAPDDEGIEWQDAPCSLMGSGHSRLQAPLFRTTVHIVRQPWHPEISFQDDHCMSPCVYLQGTAVFADSPVVLARWQEINHDPAPMLLISSRGEEAAEVVEEMPPAGQEAAPASPLSIQSWKSVGGR